MPILISCQSPTLLIKSKLLFLFVASNLCEHTRIYLQSAVGPLKVKITVEIFFLKSWISYLIFIEAGFLLKSKHNHFQNWDILQTCWKGHRSYNISCTILFYHANNHHNLQFDFGRVCSILWLNLVYKDFGLLWKVFFVFSWSGMKLGVLRKRKKKSSKAELQEAKIFSTVSGKLDTCRHPEWII